MSSSPIAQALQNIAEEKGLDYEVVLGTLESALAAAYRKDFGDKNQNIVVEFDPETGAMRVFDVKTVVEDQELPDEDEDFTPAPPVEGEEEVKRFNPKTEIMLSEAKKIKGDAELEEVIRTELETGEEFGRMAAQTAKQVITQKLREAERNAIYDEFQDKEGEIVMGSIGRREARHILVDIGRGSGILPTDEQVSSERYRPGARMKFYVVSVTMTTKGPEIVLSRAHPELVREVFVNEIPEVASGVVEIKAIAREAGNRSKVAVHCDDESIDPIGSCIGQRGTRIQTIIAELGGEKVDLIQWSDDAKEFIIQALAPAKVIDVEFNEEEKSARVIVSADQFSLAIGRGGQNVRLAAKLTGWKINVTDESGGVPQLEEEAEEADPVSGGEIEEADEKNKAEEENVEESSEETEKEPEENEDDKSEEDKEETK